MIAYDFLDYSWECPSCHSQNPGEAYACKSCHAVRPFSENKKELEDLEKVIYLREKYRPLNEQDEKRLVKPYYILIFNIIYPGLGVVYAGYYMSAFIYFVVSLIWFELSRMALWYFFLPFGRYATWLSYSWVFPFGQILLLLGFSFYAAFRYSVSNPVRKFDFDPPTKADEAVNYRQIGMRF